ncbi:endonuclease domain-containing protein [Sinomonas sp. P10A9]|uniref:Endonuclease domain-containing protein n=1 Tax=Sinomonas puerhi TaxID=3238584 RepID=A0AB39L045_9MICC
MATPTALDLMLAHPFTSAEARRLGLDYADLVKQEVTRVSRGIYVPRVGVPTLADRARATLAVTQGAWASHRTSTALNGLWLPDPSSDHSLLHLSKPSHLPRVRREGVVGHRVTAHPGEVIELEPGIMASSPARSWLDLGQELGPVSLVALGDQLIRKPRPQFEGRSESYATIAQLTEMIRLHPKMKGVAKCRAALADMRVGADSIPETLLRLCLLAYGFPEPELQIVLRPSDAFSPSADLGYLALKIAIQYDGAHHLADQQRLRDARRDAAFREAGWTVIIVTAADREDDFGRVRHKLRSALRSRAA